MMKSHVVFLVLATAMQLAISRYGDVTLDSLRKPPYQARIFALLLLEEELVPSPIPFDVYFATLKIAEERVNQLYGDVVKFDVKIKRSPIRCDSSAAPVFAAEEYVHE